MQEKLEKINFLLNWMNEKLWSPMGVIKKYFANKIIN